MADDRYGDEGRREGWRDRDSSIFSDDDDRRRDWSDDRGFFERAGDEVRSWFGDEDAEHRRMRDLRREEARSAFGGFESGDYSRRERFGSEDFGEGGRRFGSEPAWGRDEGAYGRTLRPERGLGSGSHRDENYRRWRDRQIERLDREYDEYCRERQHAFEQDFDRWRSSRLTQSGSPSTGAASEGGRGPAMEGGSARAPGTLPEATAAPAETGTESGRGRGGRSRT